MRPFLSVNESKQVSCQLIKKKTQRYNAIDSVDHLRMDTFQYFNIQILGQDTEYLVQNNIRVWAEELIKMCFHRFMKSKDIHDPQIIYPVPFMDLTDMPELESYKIKNLK